MSTSLVSPPGLIERYSEPAPGEHGFIGERLREVRCDRRHTCDLSPSTTAASIFAC